jgi:gliding motility-associated-like protein
MQFLPKLFIFLCIGLISSNAWAQNPIPSISYTGKCEGQLVTFNDESTTPIGTLTNWFWDFGVGSTTTDTSSVQNPRFIYDDPGTYIVRLTVTNSSGASDSTFTIINVYPTPDAAITTIVPCFPSAVTFTDASTVDLGFIDTRTWTIQGAQFSSLSMSYNLPSVGTYDVTLVTRTNDGCADTLTESFYQGNPPVLSFNPTGPLDICEGETQSVTVSGANTFAWLDGDTGATKTLSAAGQNKVVGFNGNQCFTEDSILVNVVPTPTAEAGSDVTIKYGEKTTLNGVGTGSISWSPETGLSDPNIATPEARPNETTEYIITVVNSNGCFDSDTVVVTVEGQSVIPVHNMITPNGDLSNDVWDLSTIANMENAQVSVFNRWGWEVFKSDAYNNNWGGTMNDDPLPDGTYVYVIKFNDGRESLSGTLEILRNTTK